MLVTRVNPKGQPITSARKARAAVKRNYPKATCRMWTREDKFKAIEVDFHDGKDPIQSVGKTWQGAVESVIFQHQFGAKSL